MLSSSFLSTLPAGFDPDETKRGKVPVLCSSLILETQDRCQKVGKFSVLSHFFGVLEVLAYVLLGEVMLCPAPRPPQPWQSCQSINQSIIDMEGWC